MQKIIIDTNVFVSSLIQRSYPYYIVSNLLSDHNIELCISDEVFNEYYDVLNREKFSKYPDFSAKAQRLLADIQKRAIKYFPTIKLEIINDIDDNKLSELAETSNANFLITGNTNDFTMKEYKGTKIVTPKGVLGNVFNATVKHQRTTCSFVQVGRDIILSAMLYYSNSVPEPDEQHSATE